MSDKKQIVIKDACILFDLIDLGILAHFYQLDIKVYSTSIVISEVVDENQLNEIRMYIESGKICIDSSSALEDIIEIIDKNKGLSLADGSVLELATRIGGYVLSSDKSLRNEAARRNIKVRGVLWVIEELQKNKIIDQPYALEI